MHTLRDARVFVDSLNDDQRRALAVELKLSDRVSSSDLALRLCEAFLLLRAIRHVSRWND